MKFELQRWSGLDNPASAEVVGPDVANHAQQGMILAHPSLPPRGRQDNATLYDVTPTCLKLLGHPPNESARLEPARDRL